MLYLKSDAKEVAPEESRKIRIWMDGEEITSDSFRVQGICLKGSRYFGWVDVYKRNAEGNHFFDKEREEVAWERRYGIFRYRTDGGSIQ